MKIRKLPIYFALTLGICVFCFAPNPSKAQSLDWAQKIGWKRNDYPKDFTLDESGNQYVVGYYDSITNIGFRNFLSRSAGGEDSLNMYIGKIKNNGKQVWGKTSTNDNFRELLVSSGIMTKIAYHNGHIYLAGYSDHKVGIGNKSVSPNKASSLLYLAKFDTSGSIIWLQKAAKSFINSGSFTPQDLIATQNGLYLTGNYFSGLSNDSLILGNSVIDKQDYNNSQGNASSGGFLLKFDLSGNFKWNRIYQTKDGELVSFNKIANDPVGKINVFGELESSLEHQGNTLNYNRSKEGTFLMQVNNSGTWQWWQVLNQFNLDPSSVGDLVTGPNGTIYAGGETRVSGGGTNGYFAKFKNDGTLVWEKTLGTGQNNPVISMAFENQNLYVGGKYKPDTLSFLSQGNIVGKFDTSGQSQWHATFGEPLAQNTGGALRQISVVDQKIYCHGLYSFNGGNGFLHSVGDELIEAGRTMVSDGQSDGFVLRYDSDLVPCYGIDIMPDFTQNEACKGDSVTLTDQTSTNAYGSLSYQWQLNNDTVYGEEIAYPLPDVLNDVSLTVETTSGCIDSVDKEVDMLPTPISNFETEKQGNGKVEFTPFSTGYGYFLWEFGDGDTASDPIVTHQYNQNKTYDVTLTTQPTDSAQCNSTTTKTINITSAPDNPGGITNQEPVNQFQLYPRPFTENLNIGYVLESSVQVKIQLVNNQGKILRTLQDTRQPAGHYRTNLRGADQLSEGLYHLVIEVDGEPYAYQVPKVD